MARLLFKGGASLSKAFGLIARFSEDIDVTVFRQDIGEATTVEELEALGRKPRQTKLDAIRAAKTNFPDRNRLLVRLRVTRRLVKFPQHTNLSRPQDAKALHVFADFFCTSNYPVKAVEFQVWAYSLKVVHQRAPVAHFEHQRFSIPGLGAHNVSGSQAYVNGPRRGGKTRYGDYCAEDVSFHRNLLTGANCSRSLSEATR